MRAGGGTSAVLLVSAAQGDSSDAGQLGINAPNFQLLSISPVILHRTGRLLVENQPTKYELLVSASAIAQQVSLLQLNSAEALLARVAGVAVGGLNLLMEAWACSINLGEPLYYRLLLRAAEPQSLTVQS